MSGGSPTGPNGFEQARERMLATYGADAVYELTIQIRGVKIPTSEELLAIRQRHAANAPERPRGRTLTREEEAAFQRRAFEAKWAETYEFDRACWDLYVVQIELERRLERCRKALNPAPGGSSAFGVTQGTEGATMQMAIAPVSDGEWLRKRMGIAGSTLNGQTISGTFDRQEMRDAPVLPENPQDLAGCGCAYLQLGGFVHGRRGLELLSYASPDPARPEVARELVRFLETADVGFHRNATVFLLARWATPEQAALLQELAHPNNKTVSAEAKQAAILALRNLKQAAARQAKTRDKTEDKNQPAPLKNLDEATPEQLAAALPGASTNVRTDLLQRLEEGKGIRYSTALAQAIPRLRGEDKAAARATLRRRMLRMTGKTLAGYLAEEQPELRLAAMWAGGQKQTTELVPTLIKLVAARRRWLHRLGHWPEAPELFPPHTTLEELPRLVADTETAWRKYLERLEEAELARELEWLAIDGKRYRWNVEGILTQTFGHAWYHRGQIAQLVAALGGQAVDTDYILWSKPTRLDGPTA